MPFSRRKKLSRYCIGMALLLFGLCLLLPAISSGLGIEFTNLREEEAFSHALFPSLFTALGLLLAGLLLTITHWLDLIIQLLLFGLVAFILYVVLLFTLFSGMCVWTTHNVLFLQRADPTTIIALRSMGCGATDSGSPVYGTFKIRTLTSNFVRVTKTDTATLDRSQWRRIAPQLVQPR